MTIEGTDVLNKVDTFTPLADRVLIAPVVDDEVTIGGVIIPENAREKPQRGTVISVGPGARDQTGTRHPIDVVEGDTVFFSKYGGTELRLEGDDYVILRETDILGRLE